MAKYDDFSRAKYSAFIYLGRKMYTRHEMMEKLAKKEFPQDICAKTVDFLVEAGYIDDTDYARKYIKDALNFKKHGVNRINQDLRRKGINQDIISQIIDELDIDNSENLFKLIGQKAQKVDISDRKQKDRLIGFLLRRGYKYDEIFSAIREYFDNDEEKFDD